MRNFKGATLEFIVMKRVIVDYNKLSPEVLALLVKKYPHGYDDSHIITFSNHKNETIEAVEVRTDAIIYLVKVSTKLASRMVEFSMKESNLPINEIQIGLPGED